MKAMEFKNKETEEYVQIIIDYLQDKFGEVKPVWMHLIKMLGDQNDLYLLAKEDVDTNGITTQTSRGLIQSPALKTMQQASVQKQKIIQALGISPNSSIKLKLQEPGQEEDEEDFLEMLTR